MKQFKFKSVTTCFVAAIAAAGLAGIIPSFGNPLAAQSIRACHENTQTAEIDVLLTAVHELTSYNGDPAVSAQHLATWSELWADDATFLVNGTTLYEGKEAIFTGFFANAPFFHNNWIGLTPSFRKQIDIHGPTAEVYMECIWLNESETVVAKRSLHGTIKKVHGKWMFWHMNTDPAAPLF
jgi:hypothetical protein